ncbi:hypothetical protein HQ865_01880 [Mucilaginibacter mali]|uniref:FAD dependent oxidoreductase domain-containing protein n=1 Tax=Mucilaginibacter mali TaxID=2740462 RepID=A0A7D4TVG3_9SPHI|nr:hypothetical protein [Mucilaginibacter mali]QKJ28557.1 hypothetical protein HQ865_01880 [Mucilaginibacter mali]
MQKQVDTPRLFHISEEPGIYMGRSAIIIIDYLRTFVNFKNWELLQSWHGIYPKMTNGETELIMNIEPGVTVINGVGGNGMTLSFGLCKQLMPGNFDKN